MGATRNRPGDRAGPALRRATRDMVVTMTTRRMAWVLAAALAACGRNEYAPPPPTEVTVAHPVEQNVTTYLEFSGRTEAVEAVDVRARVQGFLQSVHFQP